MNNGAGESERILSDLASDEDLREIVIMFVDEMPQRIEKLQSQCDAKQWAELERTAHQLKGAAGSYGFAKLSPAAAEVEQLIKKNAPESEIIAKNAELISLCRCISVE